MLSLATLDEVQRHNRDDEADEGSPCAKRTLCSRKRRDEDVLEHSKQLIADPLEPTSRTRSSFELTFACPTPAYQTPPERAYKQNKNYKLDPTDDKEGVQTHPVEYIVDRKSTCSILPIRLPQNWPNRRILLLIVLVRVFDSRRGEILILFANIKKDPLLRAPSVRKHNSTRVDKEGAEICSR